MWFLVGRACYLLETVTFFLQRVIFYLLLFLPILCKRPSLHILDTLLHLVLQAEISRTPWEKETTLCGVFPSLDNMRKQMLFIADVSVNLFASQLADQKSCERSTPPPWTQPWA